MIRTLIVFSFLSALSLGCVPKKNSQQSKVKDYAVINSPSNLAIIGDSQTAGDYGSRLAERVLKDSKQRLLFFGGASSARIHHWIDGGFSSIPSSNFKSCESPAQVSCHPDMTPGKKTKSIRTIMSQFPEIDGYLITLGDNHYYDPSSVRAFVEELSHILISSGKKCVFISPTLALGKFADKKIILDGIKKGLNDTKLKEGSTCQFVDSYSFGGDVVKTSSDKSVIEKSLERDYMGLHPSGEGAKLWADRVFESLIVRGFLNRL